MSLLRAGGIFFNTVDILYAESHVPKEVRLWLSRGGSTPVAVDVTGEDALTLLAWMEKNYTQPSGERPAFRAFDS